MIRLAYSLALPIFALLAAPFWLLKTHRRGGLSQRLWEKLGLYSADSPPASKGGIYLHAASVGEVNIALKLIARWRLHRPDARFLLAVGTSTGFDMARRAECSSLAALYAPIDSSWAVQAMLQRYQPSQIVLVEHEVWPNLLYYASRHNIPTALANARLSLRSGRRLAKLRPLMGSTYRLLDWVGAQVEEDRDRLVRIGVCANTIEVVGSIKFDPAEDSKVVSNFDAAPFLSAMGHGPVVMALSTHASEELLFAEATKGIAEARAVIIPRHMERRNEIERELQRAGYEVCLRSTFHPHAESFPIGAILVVDSTGEMPAFTRLADVVFVGKSLLARGGQNPCEAIAAKVPVVTGPFMDNFEPLVSQLHALGGLSLANDESTLARSLRNLLENADLRSAQTQAALLGLELHRGATERTVIALC